jgi:LacI family transcriptional regulator
MPVTRKDVADLAGTSPAVVSYVLNGGPRSVLPDTRERVLAAVATLGYRPNRIARSLRMSRTMTLGLVVPDNANPFFAELARAVEEAAFDKGYTLLMGNAVEDDARQTNYVRTFLDRQVDGLVLIPTHGPAGCLPELEQSGVPWVLLDRHIDSVTTASQVLVDNKRGAWDANTHVLGHGRRRVACIAGPADVPPTTDRVTGWRQAVVDAGLPAGELPVMHVPFGRRAGYLAGLELLRSHGDLDALFITSDEQAIGVLRAAAELGLRVPDDLALVSFDGIAGSAYTIPALTTIRQPIDDLGRTAVELLLERVDDPACPPSTVRLPLSLVPRGSCGCPDPPGGDAVAGAGEASL